MRVKRPVWVVLMVVGSDVMIEQVYHQEPQNLDLCTMSFVCPTQIWRVSVARYCTVDWRIIITLSGQTASA